MGSAHSQIEHVAHVVGAGVWLNLQWGNTITVIRCAAVIVSCIYQIRFLCPPEKVSPFGKGGREHFRKGGKGVGVVASCYSNTDQRQRAIL